MRRSVWLALAASLLHGKAAGSPSPLLLLRGIPGASPRLSALRARARFGGSRQRGTVGGAAGDCPGSESPVRLGCLLWEAGVRGQGAWDAPPLAFPEQPAGLSSQVSLQGEFQRKLYKELVKNYNPLERPVANDSQPLTVYFSLSLLQIMDVVSPGPRPQGFPLAALAPWGRGSIRRPGGQAG